MDVMTVEKKGFKRTDVGFIPEDWNISKLGTRSDVKTGPFGSTLHKEDYVEYGTPIITVEHIGGSKITTQNLPKVSDNDVRRLKSYRLKKGDIVFSRVGSIDRNSYVTEEEHGWLFSGRLLRIRVFDDSLSAKYLSYYFDQHSFKERIKEVAVGQTMPSLNTEILNNILISAPPTLEEQQAIASALSDVDELIRSLDRLIEKKEAIKKGTMQQLLTGNKRLPGFDGEWERKKLGDLAEVKGGKRLPKGWSLNEKKNNHPYIRVADMYPGGVDFTNLLYVPEEISSEISNYRIYEDDLFISVAGTLGIVGEVPKRLNGANLTENADRLTNIKCDKKYFLYYLLSPAIQDAIKESRTLGAQPKLAIERIKQFDVFLSNDLSEQKAIAQILSDMDWELQALRQKREKYQQVKQGMMQELLTGKTRLI